MFGDNYANSAYEIFISGDKKKLKEYYDQFEEHHILWFEQESALMNEMKQNIKKMQ